MMAEWFIRMADMLFPGKIREWKHLEGQRDKEKNFTILRGTLCPAVLTENFFMDNKKDVAYLLSEEGREAIIKCHVNGIINYIESVR
jgi:N-acetylmuramoyl-L-alanine amidase